MRIIIFSPFYPPHIGGLETHADEFNKHLSQKGVDITVFTPHLPVQSPESEIIHQNVKVTRFPAFEIISNYPLPRFWSVKFWKLFFSLFREDYDFVISRTRFFNTSLLALAYAKLKRVKWIHIEHGSDFVQLNNPFFSFLAKLYDLTLGRVVLMLSDKVIANSQASADFCKKLFSKKNYQVIRRGVNLEKIENIKPTRKICEEFSDKTVIIFIGRLIDGKGVSDLIKATRSLGEKYLLLIVGDGPQRNRLEKLSAKLALDDRIVFWGNKELEEAIGALKVADIFVNPSYTEGLPTSVIEAALCKKAIIATNVGGTPEIITNNKSGILVPSQDPSIISEKIKLLANDSALRNKYGLRAYKEVREKFSWEKSIDEYLSLLKNN